MISPLDLIIRLSLHHVKLELLARGCVSVCALLFHASTFDIVLPREGTFLPTFVEDALRERTEYQASAVVIVRPIDEEHCISVTVMPTELAQFELRIPMEVACRT